MNFADDKYLPMELWTEIMARLPVKTLLRYRCVCKTWCSLIDSPDFMYKHLQCYNNNRDITLVSTQEQLDPCRNIGCTFALHKNYTFKMYIDNLRSTLKTYTYFGGCKGLTLWCQRYGVQLILWNPSTRKSIILPPNDWNNIRVNLLRRIYNRFVVGYALSSNDYKVVEFDLFNGSNICTRVYSVNDKRWRLKNINTVNSPVDINTSLYAYRRAYVYFEGAAYWIGGYHKSRHLTETHVVHFDFDIEEFGFVELPDVGKQIIARLIFVLGDSIAVLSIYFESTRVWVMEKTDGKKDSWRLWFSGGAYLSATTDLVCSRVTDFDSEVLYDQKSCTVLIRISDKIYYYDSNNQKLQPIRSKSDFPMCFTYEESLLFSKGQTLIPLARCTLLRDTDNL